MSKFKIYSIKVENNLVFPDIIPDITKGEILIGNYLYNITILNHVKDILQISNFIFDYLPKFLTEANLTFIKKHKYGNEHGDDFLQKICSDFRIFNIGSLTEIQKIKTEEKEIDSDIYIKIMDMLTKKKEDINNLYKNITNYIFIQNYINADDMDIFVYDITKKDKEYLSFVSEYLNQVILNPLMKTNKIYIQQIKTILTKIEQQINEEKKEEEKKLIKQHEIEQQLKAEQISAELLLEEQQLKEQQLKEQQKLIKKQKLIEEQKLMEEQKLIEEQQKKFNKSDLVRYNDMDATIINGDGTYDITRADTTNASALINNVKGSDLIKIVAKSDSVDGIENETDDDIIPPGLEKMISTQISEDILQIL
jgi:hypothetical protein